MSIYNAKSANAINNTKIAPSFNFDVEQPISMLSNSCIHTIIFSKNRASQLHLLFRTMDIYYPEWNQQPSTVVVAATTTELKNGYRLLQRMYKGKQFYWQEDDNNRESLKASLMKVLTSRNCELIHLQCDDYVFVNKITNERIIDNFLKYGSSLQNVVFSVHPKLRRGIYNVEWEAPKTFQKELYWKPEMEKHEWNFQGEMSSSIWRRLDILHIVQQSTFPSVNWFEQALHYYSVAYKELVQPKESNFRRLSTGFQLPITVHVDVNVAKTEATNDIVNIDRKKKYEQKFSLNNLNLKFLNGERLNIDVSKCNISVTLCNGSEALYYEEFSRVEKQVLNALLVKTNRIKGDALIETYIQNVFSANYDGDNINEAN